MWSFSPGIIVQNILDSLGGILIHTAGDLSRDLGVGHVEANHLVDKHFVFVASLGSYHRAQ